MTERSTMRMMRVSKMEAVSQFHTACLVYTVCTIFMYYILTFIVYCKKSSYLKVHCAVFL